MQKGWMESTFDRLSTLALWLVMVGVWCTAIYLLVNFDYSQAVALWPLLAVCVMLVVSLPAGLLFKAIGGVKHKHLNSVF